MKKALLSFIFVLCCIALAAQVPQGFNYQAIARDNAGNPIANASNLQVKLAVLTDSLNQTVTWEELFNPVLTNAYGLFTVVMGRGTRQSGVANFSSINWTVTPLFVRTQIYYQGAWKFMGISRLWSVPYALTADDINGALSRLKVNGAAISLDSALFEVKNSTGQTIFAVYPEGVRIYVDNGSPKGNKGGFAVGGFGTGKSNPSQPFLLVSADSIRAYVDSAKMAKGANKGGFAVGGFGGAKGNSTLNLFYLSKKNYFIGHQSGMNTTTGLFNSFIGYQSGMNNVAGSDNVYLGYQAGLNCTASYNVMIGYQAGVTTTSGFNNIFLGYLAGFSNTTADNNVFIGSQSGYRTTSGSGNVFIGYYAGYTNTTGITNSIIGNYAGYFNNGRYNGFFGYKSGYNNTTGNYNLCMGPYAGYGATGASGGYNVFLGNYSGYGISTGDYNACLGNYSAQGITTGSYDVSIGFQAGRNLTTGESNVFLGYQAGYYADSTSFNVLIGRESGYSNNAGTFNNYIGYQAGRNVTSGRNNTFMGYQAGFAAASSSDSNNVMIGKSVGYNLTTGHDNIALGNTAGYKLTSGLYNIMIGSNAGYTNQTGNYNTMIGYQAGENLTAYYATMIGYLAGNLTTTGYSQTMIGYSSGQENTGSYNTMFGTASGQHSGAGAFNTYLGLGAGMYATGSNNVFIGKWAGYNETTTSNKLIISSNYSSSDNLNSALIYGDFGASPGPSSPGLLRFNANVGICNAYSTTYGLVVNGGSDASNSAYFYKGVLSPGGFHTSSDIRFKDIISKIDNPLEKLNAINGVYFNWKRDQFKDMEFSSDRQVGVIAQDVEKVLPELVSTDANGYKAVDYSKLSVLLIEAVKEQQKTITTLQSENAMLKDRLEKIENTLSTLKPGQK